MKEPSEAVDRLAREVVDASVAVHRELGPGYVESFYEEALAIELEARGIPFDRQVRVAVTYRGTAIGSHRVDLVIGELLLVELKAIEALAPVHLAQVLSYLRTTGLTLALLINFNVPQLRQGIRRIVSTPPA